MSEAAIHADLSVERVRAHVEQICGDIPTRLAGSANAGRMAQFACDALRAGGVEQAVIHGFPGLVSFPEPAELQVLAPVELAIPAFTLGHSLPTGPEGLTGELVDVFSGGFDDYAGKSVAGKITLSELSYSPARHEKQRIAGLKGSIGQVMMNWGHDGNSALPYGSVKPAWGNPTTETIASEMPTIPCIGIARTDGLRLRALCRQGPVKIRLHAVVENGWREVKITVGEIAAPGGPDFVVAGGHMDSWYGPQATDNAAGSACLLELARVFARRREQLRRGLVFGFWTGHETGTMIGSSWWVDQNWDRLREHMAAYLEIDQPACAGTSRWGTASNVELKRFHQAVEQRLAGNREILWHRQVKIGDSSFFGLGVPMLNGHTQFTEAELATTARATLGWWHHSIENTIDKLDFELMPTHLRIYAAYLWRLCTAPILPYEFVGVGDQFVGRLSALAAAGSSVGLEATLARARGFRDAAVRLDAAVTHWSARYERDAITDGPAEQLNACLKRLSRLLVPAASTAKGTYGHDVYGYTPQTTMLPALYDVPELGRLPESEARWLLATKLIRDRNRITDALVDASATIEQTLRLVGS